MKKPDLLVFIAVWQFFVALAIGAGIVIYTLIFPVFIGEGGWGSIVGTERMMGGVVGLGLPVLFLLCFFALALAGGIGLTLPRGREWAHHQHHQLRLRAHPGTFRHRHRHISHHVPQQTGGPRLLQPSHST